MDAQVVFETLKQELQTAPVLAMSDYTIPFHLYVSNMCDKHVVTVQMQETCSGRQKQPIAYYSTKLDYVA